MEVDLRSSEKEKRTLHWFVRGKQQKGFISGLPKQVEFGVFISFLFLLYAIIYSYLFRYAHIIKRIASNLFVSKN